MHRAPLRRYRAAALAVVAAFSVAGATAPAAPADGASKSPLPYVRGGSRWLYDSNLGPATVTLDEYGVRDGARLYRWEIRVLGVRMEEVLQLRSSGLYTANRTFLLPLGEFWAMTFEPPEFTIALPPEVGRRWEARSPVKAGGSWGWTNVNGSVAAFEPVSVPAGQYMAYRIVLLRTDTWGSYVESLIWLDPEVGVIRAEGVLRWPGVVGRVQAALHADRLWVQLARAEIRHQAAGPVQEPGSKAPSPAR